VFRPYRFGQGGQFGLEIVDERVQTGFDHVGVFGVVPGDLGDFRREVLQRRLERSGPVVIIDGFAVDLRETKTILVTGSGVSDRPTKTKILR